MPYGSFQALRSDCRERRSPVEDHLLFGRCAVQFPVILLSPAQPAPVPPASCVPLALLSLVRQGLHHYDRH